MKYLIIYESIYHGNTTKIAIAMAKALNCEAMTCDKALKTNLSEYDIVELGSGIYFTSHHPLLLKIAENLNEQQKVFIFSTHGSPFLGKYHSSLKNILNNKNIDILGEFSCRGYDCTGPFVLIGGGNIGKPNERDVNRAFKFASHFKVEPVDTNEFRGNNVLINNKACVCCGKCIEKCPLNILKMEGGKLLCKKEEMCIHCNLCTDVCKKNAVMIKHSKKELIKVAIKHAKKKSL